MSSYSYAETITRYYAVYAALDAAQRTPGTSSAHIDTLRSQLRQLRDAADAAKPANDAAERAAREAHPEQYASYYAEAGRLESKARALSYTCYHDSAARCLRKAAALRQQAANA